MFKKIINKDVLIYVSMTLSFLAISLSIWSMTLGKQKIAYVNVPKIIGNYIDTQVAQKTDEIQMGLESKVFMQSLESSLDDVSKKHKALILISDAVVKGGIDLTDVVQRKTIIGNNRG
jgi:deoxyxylulose-5-phosphate synthase